MKKPSSIAFVLSSLIVLLSWSATKCSANGGEQALAQIALHKTTFALSSDDSTSIRARPHLLGNLEEHTEWVTVDLHNSNPAEDDWVGVFSPARFNESICYPILEDSYEESPYICTSPIKYLFANYTSPAYTKTGETTLKFQLINQRDDFSFALFAGGLSNILKTDETIHPIKYWMC